ncbi:hypothetical protein BC826DRAFT_313622 [Russula brevipes]|nr:hypothetical protein BC826DRAFT_313622 [Russula brevipes]
MKDGLYSHSQRSLSPRGPLECSEVVKHSTHCQHGTQEKRGRMTIDTLPDDVLLIIFDFYEDCSDSYGLCCFKRPCTMKIWKPLLGVCRRWRYIIFESPRRLHLRLGCGERTPTRVLLDIWPSLPISVTLHAVYPDAKGEGNALTALERHNHVTSISLVLRKSFMGRFSTVMQHPFPFLTKLYLSSPVEESAAAVALPKAFLGGSAPCLERITLWKIAYPALPKLISSATRLVCLDLYEIPRSGYISPKAMASCLAAPPSLQYACIRFQSPRSRPRHGNPPPLTRLILPSLTEFKFKGANKYLEQLVSRIDAPLLNRLDIAFHTDIIFDIPQLHDFIARSEIIQACELKDAEVFLSPCSAYIEIPSSLSFKLECDTFYQGLSWTVQLCNQLSSLLFHVKSLKICGSNLYHPEAELLEDRASELCLQLFHPFTAVRNLDASKEMGPLVAHTLRDLTGERATEVLPALEQLKLGTGPSSKPETQDALKPFIAARRLDLLIYSK